MGARRIPRAVSPPTEPAGATAWRPAVFALLVGLVAGAICWLAYRLPPPSTSDFDQIWVAGRALVRHQDPYAVVPTQGTRYPLLYPLPAALIGVPFALLPLPAARVLWAVLAGASVAWAAIRYGRGLPTALLS